MRALRIGSCRPNATYRLGRPELLGLGGDALGDEEALRIAELAGTWFGKVTRGNHERMVPSSCARMTYPLGAIDPGHQAVRPYATTSRGCAPVLVQTYQGKCTFSDVTGSPQSQPAVFRRTVSPLDREPD